MEAMRLMAITIAMSAKTAMCGDKDGAFEEFLEALGGDKKDLNKTLDQAKESGLPIEDK